MTTDLPGSYKLTFKLKFEGHRAGWTNVFRFTQGNHDLKKHGDRVIALFISNSDTVHLVVEN